MLKKLGSKRTFKILFLITSFIILLLATIPKTPLVDYVYADKIQHAFAFFTLSLLLNRASCTMGARFRNMGSLLLFGIFIEIVQRYTPGRTSSVYDVLADLAGIILFQISYTILKILVDKK
jgi:VanZ family protein